MIRKFIILGYLGYHAYHDFKRQKLPLLPLLGGGILMATLVFLIGIRWLPSWQLRRTASGIVMFIFFMLVSRFTEEKIGYGDSLIIGFLALALGALDVIILVMISCFLIYLWCVTMKKKEAPYIPFLLVSYCLVMLL